MKKLAAIFIALALAAGIAEAVGVTAYTGGANDGDWHNATNWWHLPLPADEVYFQGSTPSSLSLGSTPSTINSLVFEKGAVGYTISGSTLTIDENESRRLIDLRSVITTDQTIASDLVLETSTDANNVHIITGNGATGKLILSGNISQTSGSLGVGIFPGTSNIEMSGNVDGSGKLWKVRDATGAGVLKLTGAGSWTGTGTLQIDANTEVLMNRTAADSSGFGSGGGMILQLVGGDLIMGNDQQLDVSQNVAFNATSAGTLKLDGHTETIGGLLFGTAAQSGALDMGLGGELHLTGQSSAATWGVLTILNWDEGSDHIYVDGGSFSEAQLAAITFDGSGEVGAQVVGGELIAIPEPATLGLIAFCSAGLLAARRLMI